MRDIWFWVRYIVSVLILIIVLVLYYVNPEQAIWMPKCPFHLLTGLQCPSCGSQRAIHQLLHGHLEEAWRYNPFLVVSMPYAGALMLSVWAVPTQKMFRLKQLCLGNVVVYGYLALMVIWWIFRNISA